MKRRISIDPVTRLEGHGRIDIVLEEDGSVAEACFVVPELRGFEQFCIGRQAEEMPVITSRICGICPEAHHLASVKALDQLFGVIPPPAALKIRELLYMAFFIADHTTHFYSMGGPDLLMGPDAPPAERNLFGVIRKLGEETGRDIIAARQRNHRVIALLGGRGIHPVAGLPGGWSKRVTTEERNEIIGIAEQNIAFAQRTLELFDRTVLQDRSWDSLLRDPLYEHRTYSMGTVDEYNRPNFYDGMIRVIDPDGEEFVRYHPQDYADHIAERVESWTYLKFPYLRSVGWRGLTDGNESGVYVASPLSRLNAADSMATAGAQQEFKRFYTTLGSGKTPSGRFRPVHFRLATHWARLIELLYASERMAELANDPQLLSPDVRHLPDGPVCGKGIGALEAPRGTLTHHYEADERGILTKVNMIVGTTNNHAPMAMSIKRAAQQLIRGSDDMTVDVMNRIEMAYRLYDPCLSCATHAVGKEREIAICLRSRSGELLRRISSGGGSDR
jgi:F420-non-reducing hydrogenase large subunit